MLGGGFGLVLVLPCDNWQVGVVSLFPRHLLHVFSCVIKGGEGAFGMSYFVSFTFTLHSVLRSVFVTLCIYIEHSYLFSRQVGHPLFLDSMGLCLRRMCVSMIFERIYSRILHYPVMGWPTA
jgi:hypothetical protein